jgi:DNA-3-methyladenine glycosylase II
MQEAIAHLRAADPVLAAIIDHMGPFEMRRPEPTFESLARSIVFQQLNGKAASTIFARLQDRAGAPLTPAGILKLRAATLRKVGLSQQKASYVRDLAQRTAAGDLDFAQLPSLPDADIIALLTQIKGVGVWTAQMFLMFSLERPDILPTLDFGIRSAMMKHYRLRKLPKPPRMEQIARPWRPWRTIACWYLWRSLDVKPPDAGR